MTDYLRWKPINSGTWPAEAVEACAMALCFAGFVGRPPGETPEDYWRGVSPNIQRTYREMARQTIAVLARAALSPQTKQEEK